MVRRHLQRGFTLVVVLLLAAACSSPATSTSTSITSVPPTSSTPTASPVPLRIDEVHWPTLGTSRCVPAVVEVRTVPMQADRTVDLQVSLAASVWRTVSSASTGPLGVAFLDLPDCRTAAGSNAEAFLWRVFVRGLPGERSVGSDAVHLDVASAAAEQCPSLGELGAAKTAGVFTVRNPSQECELTLVATTSSLKCDNGGASLSVEQFDPPRSGPIRSVPADTQQSFTVNDLFPTDAAACLASGSGQRGQLSACDECVHLYAVAYSREE